MLQKSSTHTEREETRETSAAEFLKAALGAARRQLSLILAVTAFAAAVGLVYLLITPTRYTAVATMVIDTFMDRTPSQQGRSSRVHRRDA